MSKIFVFCVFLIFSESCKAQCITVVEMPNYQVLFGKQIPIYDREECGSNCSNNETCIGFDWDRQNPGCFLFDEYQGDPESNKYVDHYIFIRKKEFCTGEFVQETWTPAINKASAGLKSLNHADTLQTCVESCLRVLYCVGVDWNQENRSCWIVTKSNSLEVSPGVYHYKRIRVPYIGDNRAQQNDISPLALRPVYIVIIGLGIGCILMTVVAIMLIMTRKKSKLPNVENISPTSVLEEDEVSYRYFDKDYSDQQDTLSKSDDFEKYKADNIVSEAEQTLDTIE